jgi:hypothetical protein
MQSFFVSSTFRDMQAERDALHRIVMPRLREEARQYGEAVQFVDLRWGISTGASQIPAPTTTMDNRKNNGRHPGIGRLCIV